MAALGLNRVVIVGSGVAGVRAAEVLRKRGYGGRLVMLSAEDELPYNPPPLSKELLSGELDEDDIRLIGADRVADLAVELELGRPALGLDLAGRVVRTASGPVEFDGLIIASGSVPHRLPGSGDLEGVHPLRTLADARQIKKLMSAGSPSVLVIGGGFIGCEVAAAARDARLRTTVVDIAPHLLSRALDADLSEPVARMHREHGVDLRLGTAVTRLRGAGRVEEVELGDVRVEADLVVVGIGSRPQADWLSGSGLAVEDGVLVDATLNCGVPGVYAIGDVARWPSESLGGTTVRVEHWTNSKEQGRLAAENMLSPESARQYTGVPYVWADQYGRRLQIAGRSRGAHTHVVVGDLASDGYLALLEDRGRVVGAVGLDQSDQFMRARRLISNATEWSDAVGMDWAVQ